MGTDHVRAVDEEDIVFLEGREKAQVHFLDSLANHLHAGLLEPWSLIGLDAFVVTAVTRFLGAYGRYCQLRHQRRLARTDFEYPAGLQAADHVVQDFRVARSVRAITIPEVELA